MKVTSFDPMNVIAFEDIRLYQTFLKVVIHNKDYYIQQPVLAEFHSDNKSIKLIHVNSENAPLVHPDALVIKGIGEIKGSYQKEGNTFYLKA
ncbi:hypothetical protein [Alkalicoccobacillus porphyridii]|uniref:Uncharacterized protein n=1 Tax=Alkalicoccobacillus porphyridii TaxID=2597270 RepID=A0A554A231_9BACI|nr:hypothetical protein [Alkalicoccobacillus porphyridii]TSB47735.1 hypothetical protein FN960_04245 [Alkalicoccobacillus porphyridii]